MIKNEIFRKKFESQLNLKKIEAKSNLTLEMTTHVFNKVRRFQVIGILGYFFPKLFFSIEIYLIKKSLCKKYIKKAKNIILFAFLIFVGQTSVC